jgi:hypothetical protein
MFQGVQVRFSAPLWLHSGGSWHFVTMPGDLTDDVKARVGGTRGFGSVRVRATIGSTTWTTSVFPATDGYVLPVKRGVRDAEGLDVGDTASVSLEILDAE